MHSSLEPTLILGGGFTGLFTALHLSHRHYPRPIVLIDCAERFVFKPLLYEYLSGEMSSDQVCPLFSELLEHRGVTFVQGCVSEIDLPGRRVRIQEGAEYSYEYLVLGLGSTTGYFDVTGAQQNTLAFRTGEDALLLARHLRDRLQRASQTSDTAERRRLLSVAVVGGGPTGVELAATLGDLLPQWYEPLGGDPRELRIVLINHGKTLLEGDINTKLRSAAMEALASRRAPVELQLGTAVIEVQSDRLVLQRTDQQREELVVETVVWTAGTATPGLIQSLPVSEQNRDHRGQLRVGETLQLPEFAEVFVGGDCAVDYQSPVHNGHRQDYELHEADHGKGNGAKPLPSTAQVAYQQGAGIAENLVRLVEGKPLQPVAVNLRGSLLKLGLGESAAEIYDRIEIKGKIGHLIRQATYLELLPDISHDFKVTLEWFADGIFSRFAGS